MIRVGTRSGAKVHLADGYGAKSPTTYCDRGLVMLDVDDHRPVDCLRCISVARIHLAVIRFTLAGDPEGRWREFYLGAL